MEKEDSCCHSTNKNINNNKEEEENEFGVKIRIVENDIGIHSNEYSMYSQPRDSLLEYNTIDGFDFSNISTGNQSDDDIDYEDKSENIALPKNVN